MHVRYGADGNTREAMPVLGTEALNAVRAARNAALEAASDEEDTVPSALQHQQFFGGAPTAQQVADEEPSAEEDEAKEWDAQDDDEGDTDMNPQDGDQEPPVADDGLPTMVT